MASAVVDAIGATGAALTTLCWVPQAVKIVRERETRAISLSGMTLSALGVLLWLVYGLAIVDGPLIGSSIVTLAMRRSFWCSRSATADAAFGHAADPPASNAISPCSNCSGVGGQPAMWRSTGTTAPTPPATA